MLGCDITLIRSFLLRIYISYFLYQKVQKDNVEEEVRRLKVNSACEKGQPCQSFRCPGVKLSSVR